MMEQKKAYVLTWRDIEGTTLNEQGISSLPSSLEKRQLDEISKMLKDEGFDNNKFKVHEYPFEGVYVCCEDGQENYFQVHEIKGKLIPHFVTEKFNADRINVFPCSSIKESIKLMEC